MSANEAAAHLKADDNQADPARFRHARDRESGFRIGQYLQPPPMVFTRDGHNLFLGDMYRGRAAFVLCGGPSLNSHPLEQLSQRGILTLAVNNAAVVHRPHLWCSVDDPSHFVDAIWRDPAILKFVPLCHMEKSVYVRDANDQLIASGEKVGDMPAVFGFRRNEVFRPDQWLFEDTFNWGNHSSREDDDGNKGSRSVMYIALRLLFFLGIRRVYLLGCDFKMQIGQPNYAFEQDRSAASVRSNNYTYQILNRRLEKLRPHFESHDFQVFNCTPDSGLTVFPHLAYESAVAAATKTFPSCLRTAGMYDRTANRSATRPPRVIMNAPSPILQSATSTPRTSPTTTLVISLQSHDLTNFPQTWQDWSRCHPWIRELPVVLVSPDKRVLEFEVSTVPSFRLQRTLLTDAASVSRGRLGEQAAPFLDVIRGISTDWWLKLDADATAVDEAQWWPDPMWFGAQADRNAPAIIGHRWPSIRTGRFLRDLDHWAKSVPELRDCDPFQPGCPREDRRLELPTLSSWCLFGSVRWVQELTFGDCPEVPLSLLLHYCATRQKRPVLAIDMKSLGWQHTFTPGGDKSPLPALRESAPCRK